MPPGILLVVRRGTCRALCHHPLRPATTLVCQRAKRAAHRLADHPRARGFAPRPHTHSDVCTGTLASTAEPHPATTAVSYVSNAYFPFPFAPTYFANGADCSAAVSRCSANYVACTSDLEGQGLSAFTANGGTYGVTIVVPGGTTVIGGGVLITTTSGRVVTTGTITTYPTATATSICNSLSSEASCGSLSDALCTLSATTVSGFAFGNAAPARATPFGRAGVAGLVLAGVAGLGGL